MFKYCPKCRSKKIEFINKRYFKCIECRFVYFHNIAAATAAIIIYNNQILLTTRAKEPKKGKLDLPGGFVNPNETLEQCISREVHEELGLKIACWQYFCGLPNTYTYKKITYYTQDCVFIHHLHKKPQINIAPSEIADYQWLNMDAIDTSLIAFDSLKVAIQDFIESYPI